MRLAARLVVCASLAGALQAQQPAAAVVLTSQPGGLLDAVNCTVPQLTDDGRLLFFVSQDTGLSGYEGPVILMRELPAGEPALVALGTEPDVTPNGRYVAFSTDVARLPEDTNGVSDVYLLDRATKSLRLVSVAMDGQSGNSLSSRPSVSDDGNLVAFESAADDLVPGDTTGGSLGMDIFVRDLSAGTTVRVSVASDGSEANNFSDTAAIAGGGRWVAFSTTATNLAPDTNGGPFGKDVFLHDLLTGTTSLVSVDSLGLQGKGNSNLPRLSADGRILAFESVAKLAPGDLNGTTLVNGSDVYVRDLLTGTTTRASSNPDGLSLHGESIHADVSDDGRWVTFESGATDLVPGDTNGQDDAFLFDRVTGKLVRVTVGAGGAQMYGLGLANTVVSEGGRFVAFQRGDSPLDTGEHDGKLDIYLYDRGPWTDLGGAKAGASGTPLLTGNGSLIGGTPGSVVLSQVAATAQASILISFAPAPIPFQGGVLQAWPAAAVLAVQAGVLGSTAVPFVFPAGVPSQTHFVMQAIVYPLGPTGANALSNAVEATTL